jgi:outer membrane protein TolC
VNESSTNSNGNGHATTSGAASANGQATKAKGQARKATGRKAELQDAAALIQQAEKLRTALHDLMHQANSLVKSLKQHRRQSRAIQSTLDSIRQLKGLGV